MLQISKGGWAGEMLDNFLKKCGTTVFSTLQVKVYYRLSKGDLICGCMSLSQEI